MSSLVTLDGTALDLDPAKLSISEPRRGSIHQTIDTQDQSGPGTVFQDRGIDPTDIRIALKGRLIKLATVVALEASYRKTGHVFRYTDYKGNDFQVIFEPGQKSYDLETIQGSNVGWEYTISLCVVSITSWLGGAFPPTS